MSSKTQQPQRDSADAPSETRYLDHWSLVVAVSNDQVLNSNLLASPAIDARCQVIKKKGYSCTGKAYNAGIAEASHEIIVFAHQDVQLPLDWPLHIERALSQLAEEDPTWGVLGVVGVKNNADDEVYGYCYSSGLQGFVGKPFSKPVEVNSLDEIVLIIRRSSRLKFDEDLPVFHLYGTDICLEAEKRNMKSYAASAFCIHNTNGITYFPWDFWRTYFYLRRKWRNRLPVKTCCTAITWSAFPAFRQMLSDRFHKVFSPRKAGSRWEDAGRLLQTVENERLKREFPPCT